MDSLNKNEPMVSVIIPTYNRKDKVLEAIKSVLNQKVENVEIIVVDDGSTDGTIEFLQSLNLPISIAVKENGGVSSARNVGINTARSSKIAFLDSDDLWLEGKLRAQLDYLEQHPEISIVYTDQYLNIDGKNLDQTRFQKEAPKKKLALPAFVDLTPIHTSTVLLRRNVIDTIGKFNEDLQIHEDSDFWNRISDYYDFGFIEKPLGVYRWESGTRHLTNPEHRKKFLDEGRKYLKIYKQNKNRPLTPEEKRACEESEKIIISLENQLTQT